YPSDFLLGCLAFAPAVQRSRSLPGETRRDGRISVQSIVLNIKNVYLHRIHISTITDSNPDVVFTTMFAICCAIAPAAKLKNHILDLCHNYDNNPNPDSFLVFIDDISLVYPDADEPGDSTPSTSAPFAGKTAYECSVMLKQMCKDSSENCFDGDLFAILDERSLEDGTLLLVEEPAEVDGGEAHSVRAVFEMCETQMLLWVAGKTTISEAKERAQETEDGALRPGMDL
ncbi:unnamed protein product, partial [Aureobasidium uvarum]